MKPILFNTDMTQAILSGKKTVTRRLIKGLCLYEPYAEDYDGQLMVCDNNGDWFPAEWLCHIKPEEILYVRETWKTGATSEGEKIYLYRADEPTDTAGMTVEERWHPSIHMPKAAARLFLRVKSVKAEHLQDIDEDGVFAEGAEPFLPNCEHTDFSVTPPDECFNVNPCKDCIIDYSYPEMFGKYVWNPTIKPNELGWYGWDANPWVWVIEFEKISKDEVPKW